MVNLSYQLPEITFNVIYQALHYRLLFTEEKCIFYLISPWLHDINIKDLDQQFYINSFLGNFGLNYSDIDNISSILKTMKKKVGNGSNLEIIIITSMYGAAPISKSNKRSNKLEASFLLEMMEIGGKIYFHNDLHAKMICTNGHLISGSANFTQPGLFRHSENSNLVYCETPEYKTDLRRAIDIISEAKAFNEDQNEIRKILKNQL